MPSRYNIGDTVEFITKHWIDDNTRLSDKHIGTIKEIRGGGHHADYTNPRRYIVKYGDKTRICHPKELHLICRA
jgi:hypothetical protein